MREWVGEGEERGFIISYQLQRQNEWKKEGMLTGPGTPQPFTPLPISVLPAPPGPESWTCLNLPQSPHELQSKQVLGPLACSYASHWVATYDSAVTKACSMIGHFAGPLPGWHLTSSGLLSVPMAIRELYSFSRSWRACERKLPRGKVREIFVSDHDIQKQWCLHAVCASQNR